MKLLLNIYDLSGKTQKHFQDNIRILFSFPSHFYAKRAQLIVTVWLIECVSAWIWKTANCIVLRLLQFINDMFDSIQNTFQDDIWIFHNLRSILRIYCLSLTNYLHYKSWCNDINPKSEKTKVTIDFIQKRLSVVLIWE